MKILFLAAAIISGACSREPAPKTGPVAPNAVPVALFIGDSLTAGYGVEPDEAWPAVLESSWKRRGIDWRVRNAAVSGDTSAGVQDQIAWAATSDVKVAFLCIGANDGLRGLPLAKMEANIDEAVVALQKRGIHVALGGMKIPPNYGDSYARGFEDVYSKIAARRRTPLLPFLLEGVATVPSLNQPDNLHPNAAGHKIIAARVEEFFDREGLLK